MQYDSKTRIAVHKRCVAGIEAAQGYLKGIRAKTILSTQDEADITHLEYRIKEFKLSILVVYNTERIREMREALITGWQAQIAETNPLAALSPTERKYRENQIKIIKQAQQCKVSRCGGKGWTGVKTTQGEFELCKCTLKTINFYVTLDSEASEAPASELSENELPATIAKPQ